MADFITATIIGKDKLFAAVAALKTGAQNLKPFWYEVFAPRYFAEVQDRFKTGGAKRGAGGRFAGGNWQQLSEPYRTWKQFHFPGKGILERTGVMRDSVRWAGHGLGPGGVFIADSQSVVTGTMVAYARFHQEGTSRMPARPFLDPPDPAVYAPILKQWLVQKWKNGAA